MSRIKFATILSSGKRSFSMRVGGMNGKTISLMSTIPDFVLYDPEKGINY